MSIIYSTATQNARLQAVVTQIDAGASFGVLKIFDSGNVLLCTIPLSKPSGTPAGGVLTFVVPDSATVAAGGTMAAADIEDSNGNVIASGLTVGTTAAFDIIAVTTTISAGNVLNLIQATITAG